LRNLITTIIVELYKYIAQEERETIKIRQQQGIEIAKRQGKYKGKIREYGPHSPNRQKRYIYKEACRLLNRKKDGDETLTKRQIARMLGIAPVTLYRIEKYQAEDLANVPRSER
ncbi:recombinase family protein, partial [Lacticaseibacillus paracasei]|nr:recombinase family protein [Lacticaseibacillus paracasei]MDM7542883.1 recombinase family protein [Lacticaseibacillus paracasei]